MLGKIVKCIITGLKGTATARIEYINGCVQYQVQPRVVKDGVPAVSRWYDQEQLVVVGPKIAIKPKPGGGPPPAIIPSRSRGEI